MLKTLLTATGCLSLAVALSPAAMAQQCQGQATTVSSTYISHPAAQQEGTIVETAVGAKDLSTLVSLVKQAELVDTLNSDGPFTVFAPINSAFAKLPKETVEALLKDENRDQLQGILTYHVVPGKVMAADVVKLKSAKTAAGKDVSIRVEEGKVFVNDSQVIKTDIACSNGVVHLIDSVLLPPEKEPGIVETAVSNDDFSTLVKLVKHAELVDVLSGEGPFTVFAPTNDAFAKLPKATVEKLLSDEGREQLQTILKYHVVAGEVMAEDVVKMKEAKTVAGKMINIKVTDGKVYLNDVQVTKTDIECGNGVIHVINGVLLPPSEE